MAYDFVPTTDKLSYGANPDLSASALSISCFVNLDVIAGATRSVFTIAQAGDAALGISLFWISGGSFVVRRVGSTNKERRTAASPSLSAWHHVCVTDGTTFTDATELKLFYDAVEQSYSLTQNGVTPTAAGGSWVIGGIASTPLDGRIAEFGVWNATLVQAEIDALSKGISPLIIRPTSLIFYAPLVRDPNDRRGKTATISGTTVANHPRIIYPSRQSYNVIRREVNSPIGYQIGFMR